MSSSQTAAAGTESSAGSALPHITRNGAARRAAMAVPYSERRPTSLISYESGGRAVVIGHEANAIPVAERLREKLDCSVVVTTGASAGREAAPESGAPVSEVQKTGRVIFAKVGEIRGHLGAFEIDVIVNGETTPLAPSLLTAHRPFDIVLDLCEPPFLRAEVLPPGYFAPRRNADLLERAIEDIPNLVGEFEKPKYFNYNASICAHGNSGLTGCTRCIEACPTDAIRSVKDLIEVDPYLCQGGGSCATACPTGAITYAFPPVTDLLRALRQMLSAYRKQGGEAAVVLFHDGEAGGAWLETTAQALPENVIPVEVEEIGSIGMDVWLSVVAYGARQVVMWCPRSVPGSVKAELEHQLAVARTILEGMGYPKTLLVRADEDENGWIEALPQSDLVNLTAASFAPVDEKRTNIRAAVDHLYQGAAQQPASVKLPSGAPFGELAVNKQTCTLCMACVSVCPASALNDGGGEPKLRFIEWNCVQCGLCETACPEDAVTRLPRFLFDAELRRTARVLNEDAPFHCVNCGKAFATTRVIERMQEKLKDHWMFQKPEAARRMQMCEDCRVKDMFKDGGGLLDVHGDA